MDKIVKYEVKLSVPQNQVPQHQKKFENILHTAINKGLKGTDVVTVVEGDEMRNIKDKGGQQ